MKKFEIKFKEVGSDRIGTTTHIGTKSKEEVIEFFGLEGDDVEWYEIEEVPMSSSLQRER